MNDPSVTPYSEEKRIIDQISLVSFPCLEKVGKGILGWNENEEIRKASARARGENVGQA